MARKSHLFRLGAQGKRACRRHVDPVEVGPAPRGRHGVVAVRHTSGLAILSLWTLGDTCFEGRHACNTITTRYLQSGQPSHQMLVLTDVRADSPDWVGLVRVVA
jgi:hypothetical protein